MNNIHNRWGFLHRDFEYIERHDYESAVWSSPTDLERYNGLIGVDHRSLSDEEVLYFVKDDPWPDIKNKRYALHRLRPSWVIPEHRDLYFTFRKNHDVDHVNAITRIIVFLEDRQAGHLLEIDGQLVPTWSAGDWVQWFGDTPHMAANLGQEDRYTLQITGTVT